MSALSDDSTYTFLLTTMLMLLSVMTVGVCYLLQGAPLVRSDRVSGRGAGPPPPPRRRGRRGLTPGGHKGQAVVPAPDPGRRGAQLRVSTCGRWEERGTDSNQRFLFIVVVSQCLGVRFFDRVRSSRYRQ